eukprot:scaffold11455_cov94-Cylindrotheca_fusiformis.AAC.2
MTVVSNTYLPFHPIISHDGNKTVLCGGARSSCYNPQTHEFSCIVCKCVCVCIGWKQGSLLGEWLEKVVTSLGFLSTTNLGLEY